MRTVCFHILLLLLGLSAHAQYYLRGDVRNEKKEPLNGSRIFLHSSRTAYYTGAYGSFGITTQKLNDSLTITLTGYEPLTLAVKSDQWQALVLKSANTVVNTSSASLSSLTRDLNNKGMPNLPTGNETYFQLQENRFIQASLYPATGFSLGVNKASYSNVRRFLNTNSAVPQDAVKVEEMINYFNLGYSQPENNEVFRVSTAFSDCPWEKSDKLLYVNVSAKKLNLDQIPPGNFVFLIDISGSMDMPNRLPLLKAAFQMFVKNLRPIDKVSIVTYGGGVGIYLQPTAGDHTETILTAIEKLEPAGDTPGESALRAAYKLASSTLVKGGNNRIILATDGDFNVGERSEKALDELVTSQKNLGVYLTCLGVGMGNLKDSKLQILAKKGNGNYAYLDDVQEAEKVLVKELTQTLYAVADDVFINVEFNDKLIKEYRLIGFDNKKNALNEAGAHLEGGEIGSGNSTLAIFQVKPTAEVKDWKNITAGADLANLHLFYHACGVTGKDSVSVPVAAHYISPDSLSTDLKMATAVAMLGLKLKQSEFQGNLSWNSVENYAAAVVDNTSFLQKQFLEQVKKAKEIYEPGKKRKKIF